MTSQVLRPYSVERVRTSLAHFAVGKALGLLLGFGLLLLLVRVLAIEDYAFYVAALASLEIVAQFSALGLYGAAQRYIPEYLYKGEGRRLARLTWMLCVGRLITLLMAVALLYPLTPILAGSLGLEGFIWPIRLYMLVIVLESFARFLDVIFESLLLQKLSQISLLLRAAVRCGAVASLFLSTSTPVALDTWIWIDGTAALASCLWASVRLAIFLRATAKENVGTGASINLLRYLRYAVPNYLAASLYTLSGQNVIALIAVRILPVAQFAAFGFAMSFVVMLQRYLPMFLLIGLVRPLFIAARQRTDYTERLPLLGSLVFKLNVFALAPVAALLAVAGDSVADVMTSGRFVEASGYLFALTWLLLAQSLRAVASLTAQAMEDAKAPLQGTAIGLVGLLVGIALSRWLGGYGLIFGLIVSEFLFAGKVITAMSSWHGLLVKVALASYGRVVIGGVLAGVVVWLQQRSGSAANLWDLCGMTLSALAVYFTFCFLFKPFTREERAILNGLLKRRLFVW